MKIKKYEITEELENKLKICYFKNKKFFIFGNDVLPKTYLLIPFEITAKIVFPHMIFNFAPHEEKKALNFFFFLINN